MDGPSTDVARRSGQNPRRLYVIVTLLLVLFGVGLLEIATQLFARTIVFPRFDEIRANPRHYYQASPSDVLAYELKPGVSLERDGRLLRINRWGIRGKSDDLARGRWRLAILGDSVVFGVQRGEDRTLAGLLQERLDPDGDEIRVLNFGLGGLNMAEIVEFLRVKDEIYDVHEVLYLLNLNDLAPRESVYEGADNGLYRMYERPLLTSPFFVRKAIYRWVKGGSGGIPWYEWMFSGNEEWAYEQLARMARYARENGIHFSVIILPAGVAFAGDGYALEYAHRRIAAWLEDAGVPCLSPIEAFQANPSAFIDETDHFHDAGNRRMSRVMHDFLLSMNVERVPPPSDQDL